MDASRFDELLVFLGALGLEDAHVVEQADAFGELGLPDGGVLELSLDELDGVGEVD